MPIHDWSRVGDGTFHDFHCSWIIYLKGALNAGRLPSGYYAQAEQHIGRKIADVLALHTSDPETTPTLPPLGGDRSTAVATAPPRVSRRREFSVSATRRRTLTVRQTSGHRIVALVEIVSKANKATSNALGEFVAKVRDALYSGIHVAIIDILPSGRYDPQGMHAAFLEAIDDPDDEIPPGKPLTFASYVALSDPTGIAYLEHVAVGDAVPDMPLFLTPDDYIEMPLAETYQSAFASIPEVWREVLEGHG